MTPEKIKEFSTKHAPALAEDITRLCGRVIEKGMQGIIQECVEMELRMRSLQAENDQMRAQIANSGGPCQYCSLPKAEWSKCQKGFPGCSRADDAMLCQNVGAVLDANSLLSDLVLALESTNWSSWQTTAKFQSELNRAKEYLGIP